MLLHLIYQTNPESGKPSKWLRISGSRCHISSIYITMEGYLSPEDIFTGKGLRFGWWNER
jgi:hypothetical protein